MGELFSRPRRAAIRRELEQNSIDDASCKLAVMRDRLQKYEYHLERERALDLKEARDLMRGNQPASAKIIMRQRKVRETYINRVMRQRFNIEALINDVQAKQMQVEMVQHIADTTALLQEMNALMPIEEVERIRDENEEQDARLRAIGDALAQNMSPEVEQAADAEYEAELAQIMAECAAGAGEAEAPRRVALPA